MTTTYLGSDMFEISFGNSGKVCILSAEEIKEIIDESEEIKEIVDESEELLKEIKDIHKAIEEHGQVIRDLEEYIDTIQNKKVKDTLETFLEELDDMSRFI